jgi:hypothetical protein
VPSVIKPREGSPLSENLLKVKRTHTTRKEKKIKEKETRNKQKDV